MGCAAVRLYGCTAVRLYDVRLYGSAVQHTVVRLYGCTAVRLYGVRLYGSAVRLYGCTAARLYGCKAYGCTAGRLTRAARHVSPVRPSAAAPTTVAVDTRAPPNAADTCRRAQSRPQSHGSAAAAPPIAPS